MTRTYKFGEKSTILTIRVPESKIGYYRKKFYAILNNKKINNVIQKNNSYYNWQNGFKELNDFFLWVNNNVDFVIKDREIYNKRVGKLNFKLLDELIKEVERGNNK